MLAAGCCVLHAVAPMVVFVACCVLHSLHESVSNAAGSLGKSMQANTCDRPGNRHARACARLKKTAYNRARVDVNVWRRSSEWLQQLQPWFITQMTTLTVCAAIAHGAHEPSSSEKGVSDVRQGVVVAGLRAQPKVLWDRGEGMQAMMARSQ